MDKDTALRLALEALEWEWGDDPPELQKAAITAIKAALEAKDEPVAWKWHQAPVKTSWGDGMVVADLAIDKDHTVSIYCERDQTAKVEAMFTQPHQEAKDEPVAWFSTLPDGKLSIKIVGKPTEGNWEPLYTTPPQRKPLTDEEIQQIFIANSVVVDNGNAYMVAGLRTVNITRAIEAAHGIKGEA